MKNKIKDLLPLPLPLQLIVVVEIPVVVRVVHTKNGVLLFCWTPSGTVLSIDPNIRDLC